MFMYLANRGFTMYYLEEYEKSITDLTAAIELNRYHTDARIYETRAAAHQLLGNNKQSVKDHKLAMKLDRGLPLKVFPFPIPLELIVQVFWFLPRSDLKNCRLTCKLWNEIVLTTPQLRAKPQNSTTTTTTSTRSTPISFSQTLLESTNLRRSNPEPSFW